MRVFIVGLLLVLPGRVLAAPERDLRGVVDASAGVGARLYRLLRARDGNLFFSPASISWAMGMTHAGARGATARQLARAMGFRLPAARQHRAQQRLLRALRAAGERKAVLAVANALWCQRGHPFLPGYEKLVQARYGGQLAHVDFAHDRAGARGAINGGVEKATRGQIGGLLPEGSLGPLTRLVLTSAVYFKGDWTVQFPRSGTRDDPFRLDRRRQVTVPLMRLTGSFRYRGNRRFQVLELPYKGGAFSMVVLLPRRVGQLAAVARYLRPAALRRLLRRLPRRKVRVQLPRFSLSRSLALRPLLERLGVRQAFRPGRADLSGIDGTRELYLSAVLHRARIEVNEEGAEAAAGTAAIMPMLEGENEHEPPLFRADRPFLFLIRHRPTGAVLFVGRLSDPGGAPHPIRTEDR